MTLLTDRSLYRPGQTVYVKGIAYMQNRIQLMCFRTKEYTVTLLDVNNQEVGRKSVRTNEFGSFYHRFRITFGLSERNVFFERREETNRLFG